MTTIGHHLSEETKAKMSAVRLGQKHKPMSEQGRKNLSLAHIGQIPWNKGKTGIYGKETIEKIRVASIGRIPSAESRKKMSDAQKGRPHPVSEATKINMSLSRIGMKLSDEHKNNISRSLKGKPKSTEARIASSLAARRGENCHFWKGGVAKENNKLRHSMRYRLWRESVYSRDNWTCQKCFVRGGSLHPHHLKKWSDYPDLRFSTENGLTLCEKCHKKEHQDVGFFKSHRADDMLERLVEG